MSQPLDRDPGWGNPSPPAAWASPNGAPADDTPSVIPPAPEPTAAYGSKTSPGPVVAPGAWRPPTLQPGIIALRPLGLGEILDGAMKAVRFNPKVTFGLTAVVITVCVTVATLLTTYLSGFFMPELRRALGMATDDSDALALMMVSQYSTAPFLSIATPLLNGLLILAVSKAVLGQKVSVSEVVHSTRIWAVLGFSLLVSAGTVIISVLFLALVVLLASLGTGGAVVAVLLAVVGGLALVAGSVWLTVRTLLVPAALMLEGKGFWATIARSWKLTYRSFWRLLGIYALVVVMLMVLTSVVSVPLAIVGAIVAVADITWATLLVTAVNTVLSYTITIAFEAVIVALLYIDVRMRREGLDLELARAAEVGEL